MIVKVFVVLFCDFFEMNKYFIHLSFQPTTTRWRELCVVLFFWWQFLFVVIERLSLSCAWWSLSLIFSVLWTIFDEKNQIYRFFWLENFCFRRRWGRIRSFKITRSSKDESNHVEMLASLYSARATDSLISRQIMTTNRLKNKLLFVVSSKHVEEERRLRRLKILSLFAELCFFPFFPSYTHLSPSIWLWFHYFFVSFPFPVLMAWCLLCRFTINNDTTHSSNI